MRIWLGAILLLTAASAATDVRGLLDDLRSGSVAERRAAAVRLGELGDAGVTPALALALRDADREVRQHAQAALWAIWLRSGNSEVDALLHEGITEMEQGRYGDAVALFSEVIARAPAFAEGWNKRATVYYLMGEYDRSLADCEQVIGRNPLHFGALSGFGLNFLQKGDLENAARYFERALAVNPNMPQIDQVLEQIRGALRQRLRQAI